MTTPQNVKDAALDRFTTAFAAGDVSPEFEALIGAFDDVPSSFRAMGAIVPALLAAIDVAYEAGKAEAGTVVTQG
jgi:hypothetical protein